MIDHEVMVVLWLSKEIEISIPFLIFFKKK